MSEHGLDHVPPVRLAHTRVDALVADEGQLAVLDRGIDQHAVALRRPVHAEPLEDPHRAGHGLTGAGVIDVDANLRRRLGLRGGDRSRDGLEVRLAHEAPRPPWMTGHHQLPLAPPPPKLPPPPLKPPPSEPPPLPPQAPPPQPPPIGPPQPELPPVQP